MHAGSLESTQEARVALGELLRIFRALQTSRVHHNSIIRTLSMNKFLIYSYLKGGAFTEVEKDEVF